MNGKNVNRPSDELIALTEGYSDGTITDVELARLEELLVHDTATCSYFLRYLGLDAALHEHGAGSVAPHLLPALHEPQPTEGADEEGGLAEANEDAVDSEPELTPRRQASSRSSLCFPRRRWQVAGIAGIALVGAAAILMAIFIKPETASPSIGNLQDVTGDVRLLGADGQVRETAANVPIVQGDTLRTRGSESSAVVVYPDDTRLTLVGHSSATFADHRSKTVVVHQGTIVAWVKPQPAEKLLLLTTPLAQLQVLGTRFQIEALEDRTNLRVSEGRVRLVRISDQKSVDVPDGKSTSVTEQNKLLVKDIPGLPQTWGEDFETGLPEGWDNGEWVTQGLPQGSQGAVKATWSEGISGANFSIRSNAPWLEGIFSAAPNSHLHVTFKSEKRSWINIFIVTRTADVHEPRFSGNYLLEDFPKRGSGQWETITIPLSDFRRIHAGTESLAEVVPYKLMFVFDGVDRGLVVDRVWVTPDGPGHVVSELFPQSPAGGQP